MNLPTDIDPAEYAPQGRTADELAQQQAALLALFEQWENVFATLRRRGEQEQVIDLGREDQGDRP